MHSSFTGDSNLWLKAAEGKGKGLSRGQKGKYRSKLSFINLRGKECIVVEDKYAQIAEGQDMCFVLVLRQ